ncbi:MAG: YfiR family protein [Bacteroidetes bacterium]|nr:YfiR family protein [Bacteroidota bacterium]
MIVQHLYASIIKFQLKIALSVAVVLGCEMQLFSQSAEYTMKAVAFEKLSLFISWQANVIKNDPSQEFVIAVLGQNPFGNILKDVYKDKKIKDKRVKIVYFKNIKQLPECQILFISKIDPVDLQKVLSYVKGRPILTISDTEGFAEAGCFINFYIYENKLRFEINQKGMQDAGFTIDYRLLRVSKILNPTSE